MNLGGRRGAALAVAATMSLFVAPANAQADQLSTIRSEQTGLVQRNFEAAIGLAELRLSQAQAAAARDSATLSQVESAAAAAGASLSDARAKLNSDTQALQSATAARSADHQRVEEDRAGLSVIAVALYTGVATNLQPTSLHALETGQEAVIEAGEVEAVESVLDRTLKVDDAAANAADHRWQQLAASVAADDIAVRSDNERASSLAHRASLSSSVVAGDKKRLTSAEQHLSEAQGALHDALAALLGPTSSGLSILGGSALSASQLVGWYNWEGYVDFTSASIQELAAWYVDSGHAEGVRGDVAFAQAILETGGFSSPDSVYLSNFAGIGHCDSCNAGWDFPSPDAGVLGQLQLLRVWAGGGESPGAPGPVVAAIAPSNQALAGCCSTWESLTGEWATDPYYGSEILRIYQQMLEYALSR